MATEKSEAENGKPTSASGNGKVDLSGVEKRGPGRPKGSTNKNPDAGGSSKRSEADTSADAEFLADALVTIFEIGDEILQRRLLEKIRQVVPEKAEEFRTLQNQVRLNEKDTALIRKCVARIAAKYALLAKFAPEILLLGVFAQYGFRQIRMIKFVEEMAAEKAKGIAAVPVGKN